MEDAGDGTPIVLAHGLTATRRYVVHGSRLLERSGYRVVSYDARGHGDPSPAPDPSAYELRGPGRRPRGRARRARHRSRRARRASRWAPRPRSPSRSRSPSGSRALVQITPAHLGLPSRTRGACALGRARGRTRARRRRGIHARLRRAAGRASASGADRDRRSASGSSATAIRRRSPTALRVVPRSTAFEGARRARAGRGADPCGGEPGRADPEHPLRDRRGLCGAGSDAPSWSRGTRLVAPRLAGSAALEGDLGLSGAESDTNGSLPMHVRVGPFHGGRCKVPCRTYVPSDRLPSLGEPMFWSHQENPTKRRPSRSATT